MTTYTLNLLTALMLVSATLLAGCSVTQTAPGAQAVPADEPVTYVGVVEEEPSATDSERVARDSAEMERIRIEVQNANGPVQNAPDYNR